jgi:hypothetical protein
MPRKSSRPQKQENKKRNWAFVLYPESAPTDWKDILQRTGLQCCVSPLHDSDLNADETEKKPHWHIILCYSGPTSYNVVQKLTEELHATIPQALEQIKGYYRYLTHKDNPEKTQYRETDIISINGFTIRDYVDFTVSEKLKIQKEIINFIEDNDISELCDLTNCIMKMGNDEWLNIIANYSTMYLNAYLRSRRYKAEKQMAERLEIGERTGGGKKAKARIGKKIGNIK